MAASVKKEILVNEDVSEAAGAAVENIMEYKLFIAWQIFTYYD